MCVIPRLAKSVWERESICTPLCKNYRFLLVYIHTCHKLFLNMPTDHLSIPPAYHKITIKKVSEFSAHRVYAHHCVKTTDFCWCTYIHATSNMPIDHMSIPPAYHKNTIKETQRILCSQGICTPLCKNYRFLLVYIHTCHKLFLNMPIDHKNTTRIPSMKVCEFSAHRVSCYHKGHNYCGCHGNLDPLPLSLLSYQVLLGGRHEPSYFCSSFPKADVV